jgi:hypothetical protein
MTEAPSRYWLRNRLSSLLARIDELRDMPDADRSAVAPVGGNGELLAPTLRDYRAGRVVDEVKALERGLEDNLPALRASGDAKFTVLLEELRLALGRMRVMLQPGQQADVWRRGEIPQRRHLNDQPPILRVSELGVRAVSRMPALREQLDREAFRLLQDGLSPESVRRHPRMRQLQRELRKAARDGAGQPESPSLGLQEAARADWHAHSQIAERVEAWENAEALVQRLFDSLRGGDSESATQACVAEGNSSLASDCVSLNETDVIILKAMKSSGTLLHQANLASDPGSRSRGTIGKRLRRLEELDLVHRPDGPRGGYGITSKGRDCLKGDRW